MQDFVQCPEPHPYYNLGTASNLVFGRGMVYVGEGRFLLEREVDVGRGRFIPGADLHLFQTRFVIGWENNRDGDITMPLSLKTIGSAGYKDQ